MTAKNKRLKRGLLMFTATAILLLTFVSCSTVSENAVMQMTSIPTSVVENFAAATLNTQITSSATVTGTATAKPSATGNETGNVTVNPTSTQKPSTIVKPTATATKKLTATQKKTAPPTKAPTKKPMATKTATPKPTATVQKTMYQTITYEGKTYKVLMGRNGNPNLIKDYSTLPKVLQAYAYPTFDKEAVMMDIYQYAKSKGFKYFSNPNVPLLKESSVGYNEYPEGFTPGGNMNETLALNAFSWYSPSLVNYAGDSVYTDEYYATELDDIIAQREGNFSMVDFLAMQGMDYLCLWIRDYGDSSYRKTYWDNGLYNGKVTKEYALYFMYGGRDDLLQEVKI